MAADKVNDLPTLWHPGDAAFDEAQPWNRAVVSRPRALALVESAGDVADALSYARGQSLRVAVRCTGHGAVPLDDDVLLVHTRRLSECTVHPGQRWARVGAGVRWRQVVDAAAVHGLAPVCGAALDVGVVGYLSGGGIGPLARTFGISSDFVRALDVVTADGQVLHVTPTEHEDLFWAFRGGRSTLGIITSIEIDLVDLSAFYGGALWFDSVDARPVLQAWRRWSRALPDEATTSAAVIQLPLLPTFRPPMAGSQVLAVRFAWVGSSRDGEQCLDQLRSAAVPLLDDVRNRTSTEIGSVHNDPSAARSARFCSALLDELPHEAVDLLLDSVGTDGNVQSVVELRVLGGAIARPPRHPSAVSHRDAAYLLFMSGTADPSVGTAAQSDRILAALAPWTCDGLFPNFATGDRQQTQRCYDDDARFWLGSLAAQYDPDHVMLP